MSMIECINHKNSKDRSKLISDLHNSIECLDEMIPRLSREGASREITNALMRAREQIHFEHRKMVAEMRCGNDHE